MNELGCLLRKYRKLKSMTLEETSRHVGIGKNHLSQVELGKKGVSKEALFKLTTFLGISDKEIFEALKNKNQKENKNESRQKQLEERELELINSYDFIREQNSTLSRMASINRLLIDYAAKTEEFVFNLELLLADYDYELLKKIKRPLDNTLKSIENKMERLAIYKINNFKKKEREIKNMDISNLIGQVPIKHFTPDQIRVAILTWVAEEVKLRLKDYNVDGCPSGHSRRLWGAGRGTKDKRNYMEDRISSNINSNISDIPDEEMDEVKEEIASNIIQNSLIVLEDFLKAARGAKTQKVRDHYLRAMSNKEFLLSTLLLSIVLYSRELLKRDISLNHEYLTIRLKTIEINKTKLNKIWISYAKEEITYAEAQDRTSEIIISHERDLLLTQEQVNLVTTEKLVYKLLGEDQLKLYLVELTDSIAQALTGKIRLIPINEIS